MGVYDPAYADLSLGFASMLYEIRWAQERGLDWFYPGYVLPGDDAMDYKLRVGAVEHLDGRGAWLPWSTFDPNEAPSRQVERRLDEVAASLADRGAACTPQLYPMFEAPAWHANLSSCLADPLFIAVPLPAPRALLAITWDLDRQAYRLRRCLRAAAVSRSLHEGDDEGTPVELIVVLADVATRDAAGAIAAAALAELNNLPRG